MTSAVEAAGDPSPTSDTWTNRTYREHPYSSLGYIDFIPPVIARHVAVYSQNYKALSLAEVEVYGECFENKYSFLIKNYF